MDLQLAAPVSPGNMEVIHPGLGEEEMDTRREAEGGLLARSEALDLAVQGA